MLIYDIRPPYYARTNDFIFDTFVHAFDEEPQRIIDLRENEAIKNGYIGYFAEFTPWKLKEKIYDIKPKTKATKSNLKGL